MLLRICFAALVLLVCLPSSVHGEDKAPPIGELTVHISGLKGSVNCPADDPTWKDNKDQVASNSKTLTLPIDEKEDFSKYYTCVSGDRSRKIYLQIRACEDCVELGIAIMAGIVLSDLLVTLIVLALVYYCSRSRAARAGEGTVGKSSWGQSQGKKADQPPPVPNPDYEPIRKGQRDVYAGLQAKAF